MKKILLLLIPILFLMNSCTTFDKETFYGHWKNANWEFVFNEDGSCKVGKQGQFLPGTWRYTILANSLEIIKDESVFLANLSVKSVEGDKLTLEFREIKSESGLEKIQILDRVKE